MADYKGVEWVMDRAAAMGDQCAGEQERKRNGERAAEFRPPSASMPWDVALLPGEGDGGHGCW